MKKIIFTGLLMLSVCGLGHTAPVVTTSYVSPNDVSITTLNDNQTAMTNGINSADGTLIKVGTVTAGALDNNANPEKRWADSFSSFVATGLLPPTSASLTATTTSGRALIKNTTDNKMKYVEKDATSKTYTASKWTYVDLSDNGTYTYVETNINTSEPGTTANSIRLARVSSGATTVGSVRDDRTLGISLGGTQEDFQRVDLTISVVTPAAITVDSGMVYHGTTRISKTSDTSLALGTATDWATGISGRATATTGFVVISSAGSVKLTDVAPTLTDISENTDGKLRYSVINAANWRVLNWFYMNATGSGNIDAWGFGNFKDGSSGLCNGKQRTGDTDITTTETSFTDMTDMEINFYSSGGDVVFDTFATLEGVATTSLVIDVDGTDYALQANRQAGGGADDNFWLGTKASVPLTQGEHTVKTQWKVVSGTGEQPGSSDGRRLLSFQEM